VITVLDGPDHGQRVPLSAGTHIIGRSADCDLQLSDSLVSRRHVQVLIAPGSAEVLDLGSANGPLLNDEPTVRGSWHPGDQVRLGDTVLGIDLTTWADDVGRRHGPTTWADDMGRRHGPTTWPALRRPRSNDLSRSRQAMWARHSYARIFRRRGASRVSAGPPPSVTGALWRSSAGGWRAWTRPLAPRTRMNGAPAIPNTPPRRTVLPPRPSRLRSCGAVGQARLRLPPLHGHLRCGVTRRCGLRLRVR
jgi:hypothetical protein